MTFIKPCYQVAPEISGSAGSAQPDGTVRVIESEVVVIGELVGCLRCHAYLDGYLDAPSSGFCPDCGTHIKTLRKQQAMHDIIARRYESQEVA